MSVKKLSIIIPVGPDEDQLHGLLDDLVVLPEETEIILVTAEEYEFHHTQLVEREHPLRHRIRRVQASPGRASQQNAGAAAAQHEYLWFLHADSRVKPECLTAIEAALATAPDALHYFCLAFIDDGPRLIRLNEWGARLRSQILGLPFGDQGFCLHRDQFARIGGFPEHAPYGEDHLLIWHARQAGIRLRCTGTELQTSARKYREKGWLALTLRYQFLWIKQALPEGYKLIRSHRSAAGRAQRRASHV